MECAFKCFRVHCQRYVTFFSLNIICLNKCFFFFLFLYLYKEIEVPCVSFVFSSQVNTTGKTTFLYLESSVVLMETVGTTIVFWCIEMVFCNYQYMSVSGKY